jgi:DNA-binding IclR family transcriptional regulator
MSARIDEPPRGAQSIRRMAMLVRMIGAADHDGARLGELTRLSGLEQPTVRRMLKALIAEGMVAQEESTRRYFLGQSIYELGLIAARRFRLRDLCQAALDRVARETGDTVFLMVRSGNEAVCVDRREGSFPIKAFELDIGDRRPLGVGAGALALLSALPDAQVRRIAEVHAELLPRYGVADVAELMARVQRARRLGFALHDARAAPGIKVVGVALLNSRQEPVAAFSVSAIASRMNARRQKEAVALLREQMRGMQGQVL